MLEGIRILKRVLRASHRSTVEVNIHISMAITTTLRHQTYHRTVSPIPAQAARTTALPILTSLDQSTIRRSWSVGTKPTIEQHHLHTSLLSRLTSARDRHRLKPMDTQYMRDTIIARQNVNTSTWQRAHCRLLVTQSVLPTRSMHLNLMAATIPAIVTVPHGRVLGSIINNTMVVP